MKLANFNRNYEGFPVYNNFFDNFLNNDYSGCYYDSNSKRVPAANIIEGKDDFRIELAVPGMSKKDFKINLDKNILTVEGGKEIKNEENIEKFTRKEFSYNVFKRSFKLIDSVDSGKIDAKYSDGVLNIIIPKREEAKEKPIREIKVS